jgi:hypothetical protein
MWDIWLRVLPADALPTREVLLVPLSLDGLVLRLRIRLLGRFWLLMLAIALLLEGGLGGVFGASILR